MAIKSRAKGKRGELAAVAWLRSIGYVQARRSQQYNGTGDGDVVCDELPGLHIEAKFGVTGMDIGTMLLAKAVAQAENDSKGKRWVVLWKPSRRDWRMTLDHAGHLVTLDQEEAAKWLMGFECPNLKSEQP